MVPLFVYSKQGGDLLPGQSDLWASDGSIAGTTELSVPGASGGLTPVVFRSFGSRVFFRGQDGQGNLGLWATDGSGAGTLELFAGFAGPITVFGNQALFNGANAQGNLDLWVTDGTALGTRELDVPAGNAGLDPFAITSFGTYALFNGPNPLGNAFGLWATDGTVAGTRELGPGVAANSDPVPPGGLFTQLGTRVLYASNLGDGSLWVTDGTAAGTAALIVSGAGPVGLFPTELTVLGTRALFAGEDAQQKDGLWTTDGTEAGTVEIASGSAPEGLFPSDLTVFGSKVVFAARDAPGKSGLWITDGTSAGTFEIALSTAPISQSFLGGLRPQDLTVFGNKVLFSGVDDRGISGLWVTDGTAAGTAELTVAGAASAGLSVAKLTVVGNKVFFSGNDLSGRPGLWVTDGTAAGTTEVVVPGASTTLGLSPTDLEAVGGELVFTGFDSAGIPKLQSPSNPLGLDIPGDYSLFVTDGTAAGTHQLSTGAFFGYAVSAIPTPSAVSLHGQRADYKLAMDADGAAVIQDTVADRDGSQTIATLHDIIFTDGIGRFDATGNAEEAARLYQAALGRLPDTSGLDFWAGQLDSHTLGLNDVALGFVGSAEFGTRYGSLENLGFVQQLYQNVLGRPGDSGGVQFWTDQLASGAGRAQVLVGFSDSIENKVNTSVNIGDKDRDEAYRLYQAAFNRTPDSAGLNFWTGQLDQGMTAAQVAQGFVGSAEFAQLVNGLGTTGLVDQLYQNVLHRAADAGGEQFWVGQLDSGTSRADVLLGFSDSLENRLNTSGATHDGWVFLPGQTA
jgi:ELWxxDGT repeat protein